MNEEPIEVPVYSELDQEKEYIGQAKVWKDGIAEIQIPDKYQIPELLKPDLSELSIGFNLNDGPTEDLSDTAFTKAIRGGAKVNREGPRTFKEDDPEVTQPMSQALGVVLAYYNEMWRTEDTPITSADVRLVWFSKTLENWKAMVITTLNDKYYFEVTHSGARKKTFVDVYEKIDNVELDDETWIDGNS